jgi:uncharacterized protein with FMN-binding domain
MRRAPFVIAGSVVGLAGLLSFHSHEPKSTVAVEAAPGSTSSTSTSTSTSTSSGATTSGSSSTTSTSVASSSQTTKTATGTVEQYPYGQLSVTVSEKDGRITDVEVASLSEDDPHSVEVDDQAIPQLRQEVLAADSANIDGVSGATYTSQAYQQSVQSALDKLGLA